MDCKALMAMPMFKNAGTHPTLLSAGSLRFYSGAVNLLAQVTAAGLVRCFGKAAVEQAVGMADHVSH